MFHYFSVLIRASFVCAVIFLLFHVNLYFASAHSQTDADIEKISQEIKSKKTSASLYLKRGKLYRIHGNIQKAIQDFQTAQKLSPGNMHIKYQLGLAFYIMNKPQQSVSIFNQLLKTDPNYIPALLTRARAYHSIKVYKKAAIDYESFLNKATDAKPEVYLETANNYVDHDPSKYQQALAVLDQGIGKLGVLVQLQSRAIEIELLINQPRAALRRIEGLLTTLNRKEIWLVKKAEILTTMGQVQQAKINYRLALRLMEELPPARRHVEAMSQLNKKIRKALHNLESTRLE